MSSTGTTVGTGESSVGGPGVRLHALAGLLSPWTVGRVVDSAASVDAGYRTALLLTAALLGTT
ncbi:hypothetical protein [Streptomyces sp. NPDC048710]|uniref:hypothetical protein n=1 Tax=unclassified Streptomyces TaxID=2593676 RepID=UPI003721AF34